jgi:hypothetical protein
MCVSFILESITQILKKCHIHNHPYPSMALIIERGCNMSLNSLGETFNDLWVANLICAHVVQATKKLVDYWDVCWSRACLIQSQRRSQISGCPV